MQTDSSQKHIAFIGLGVMGRPMAINLVRAGFPVRGFDVNPAAMEAVAAFGVTPAANPADAARGADVLIAMVVNDAQTRDVLFGEGSAAAALAPNATVIGMSTMSRAAVIEITAQLAERGLRYIDAPVSGGEIGAQQATLSIMVGAPAEVLEAHLPVLRAMGKNIYHIGERPGDGQAMKMINQLLVCIHNAAAAEALVFAQKLGLDAKLVFEVIGNSAGNSWMFQNRGARMIEREFEPPKSALSILVKDVGIVMGEANAARHPLVLGGLTQQLYHLAAAQGWSHLDDSILIRLMEMLTGTSAAGQDVS